MKDAKIKDIKFESEETEEDFLTIMNKKDMIRNESSNNQIDCSANKLYVNYLKSCEKLGIEVKETIKIVNPLMIEGVKIGANDELESTLKRVLIFYNSGKTVITEIKDKSLYQYEWDGKKIKYKKESFGLFLEMYERNLVPDSARKSNEFRKFMVQNSKNIFYSNHEYNPNIPNAIKRLCEDDEFKSTLMVLISLGAANVQIIDVDDVKNTSIEDTSSYQKLKFDDKTLFLLSKDLNKNSILFLS